MKQDDQSLVAFQSLLDSSPSTKEQTVELSALRRLAARGIPSEPPHLRPITYSLLLGVLGKQKSSWEKERSTGRDKYCQFAENFLKEVEDASAPSHPLSANDKLLDSISKDVNRTQTHLNFFSQPITYPRRDSAQTSSQSYSIKHRRALANRNDAIQSAVWPSAGSSIQTGSEKSDSAAILTTKSDAGSVRQGSSEVPINSNSIGSDNLIRTNSRDQTVPTPSIDPSTSISSLALPELPPLDFSDLRITSNGQPTKEDSSTTPTSISNVAPTVSLLSTVELHSDALTRILYIFTLIHPHLAYTQGFAEILAPLYFVYASASVAEAKAKASIEEYEQAAVEGDTFWAFVGLMAEVGNVVKGPGAGIWSQDLIVIGGVVERDVKWALKRLSDRVKWADLALWEELNHKSLDPALPYYSFKWISTLLAQDVPMESLLRIWDFVLSEPSTTRTETPKIDLLLDVCTAMLLLTRKPLIQAGRRRSGQSVGLWGDVDEQNGDFGEGFVEGMALLQRYPLSRIGLDKIIELAQESRQRRLLADLNGDGPDDETLGALGSTSLPSVSSFATRLFRPSHQPSLSISSVPEEGPMGDASDNGLDASTSSQSSRYSLMLKKVEAFKESDTAAALSKRSSNLTAAALSKWEDYNKPQRLESVPEDEHTTDRPPPPPPKPSNRSSWTAKLWGSSQPPSSPVSNNFSASSSQAPLSMDSVEKPPRTSNGSITPSSSYSSELSAHLVATPTKVVLTPNKSLQDRLAAKLSTPAIVTPERTPVSSPSVSHSAQKPLLLSSSARPPVSSSPHGYSPVGMSRQSHSESSSSVLSPLSTSGSSSPPPSFASRQPVSPCGSESESGSSRVPIGSRRSFSGSVGSDYSQPKTSFLKTSAKSQMSGIKFREKPSAVAGAGPGSGIGTNGSSDDHFTRPPTRSPRSRALGSRTRSSASSYAGSDSDSMIAPPRSASRLSTLSSGEGSQRGWTLVDGDSVQSPSNATQVEDPTFERSREPSSETDHIDGPSENVMPSELGRPLTLNSAEVTSVSDVRVERMAGPSPTKPTVGSEGESTSSVGAPAVKPTIITTNLPSADVRTQHTPVGTFGASVSTVASPSLKTPSSSPSVNQSLPFQHYRVRSTSSNGSSPVGGPRGPRKVSTSSVTIGGSGGVNSTSSLRQSPAVKVKQTRPTSIVSNTTDADDEGSVAGDGPGYDDLLDGYSQNEDPAVDLEAAARKARRANRF
ncbi:GTPase-activating protein [Phaffia rhodozyma]|uniref:GTPase-activating protein n=1 Tax=Phaffia rhodozyma TaxID=264483 RepID=A0A0F7ST02_PHARH|nr:GTPase-activating protein [Phaffia rhodozyma]